MQNTANHQPGGSDAAQPHSSTPNFDDFEDFEKEQLEELERSKRIPYQEDVGNIDYSLPPLPPWAEELDNKSELKFNEPGCFYYLSHEDYLNGLSDDDFAPPELPNQRTDYSLGNGLLLRTVVIGGVPWCSLEDAAEVVGVPTGFLTGWLPEDQYTVRATQCLLFPNGLRCLYPQGIEDSGIQLDALVNKAKQSRSDDPRIMSMLYDAVADVRANSNNEAAVSSVVRCVDLWQRFALTRVDGQISLSRFNSPDEGKIEGVQLGTWFWPTLACISQALSLDHDVLIKIAGPARTLEIPDKMLYPKFDSGGATTFIRADVVEKLHAALPKTPPGFCLPFYIKPLAQFEELIESGESGDFVMATSLHGMIGPLLDFDVWSYQIWNKYHKILTANHVDPIIDKLDDYSILLYLAREIAADEGTFAGKITAALLADGGFLHGGSIDEAADATLLRFQGLVPDRHGRVQIRKIWEFMNLPQPFAEWYRDRLNLNRSKDRQSPGEPTACIYSPWAFCIWQTFDSYHGVDLK